MIKGILRRGLSGYGEYMTLADGHNSNAVYKFWNSTYNDCVITIKMS